MRRVRLRWRRAWTAALALLAVAALAHAGEPAESVGTEVVVSGLDRALYVTAPDGDDRLFIVQQPGEILIFEDDALLETPFLDLSSVVSFVNPIYSERGLLGLAFHPDYPEEPCFFVNYTDVDQHATTIARYTVSDDPNVADAESGVVLQTYAQPAGNHNGGHLAFGPEATPTLYIGMGDGGGQDDSSNLAQNRQTALGKMLRFEASCSGPLTIPTDNPFTAANDPKDEVLDEIWSIGLRNPYRFSFDRETGDLYIGDVGQDDLEEISFEAAGSLGGTNFGWRIEEGTDCFDEEDAAVPCGDPSLTPPIHEYRHSQGCSVTGGYVYRGAIDELDGHYFFGDWCRGTIWSFRYDPVNGVQDFTDRTASLDPPGDVQLQNPTSFGEDGHGELYIVTAGSDQALLRVVPEPGAFASIAAGIAGVAALRRFRGARRTS